MPNVRINQLKDEAIRAFMTRVDEARGANTNGRVDSKEAAAAGRKIKKNAAFRRDAIEAFGRKPTSGADLLRLAHAAISPRGSTVVRVGGSAQSAGIILGKTSKGQTIALSQDGDILLNNKKLTSLSATSRAMDEIAPLLSGLRSKRIKKDTLLSMVDGLEKNLKRSLSRGGKSLSSRRLYAGTMSILLALSKKGSKATQKAVNDVIIDGLERQQNRSLKLFYFGALKDNPGSLSTSQKKRLTRLQEEILPTHPPVAKYTNNRKRPLVVQHTIHKEFWEEELDLYTSDKRWKLTSKNRADTERRYEATLKDPSGKKKPLKVKVTITKGEMDFFDKMGDRKTHVILYSGHSSLGGNSSQAIDDAPYMKGTPKTVFVANCRGKDNTAEFVENFPEAMLISTRAPTYGDDENRRVKALYDMFAREESFAYMRKKIRFRLYDEPSDNYIFPDEIRALDYIDRDRDGHMDKSPVSSDPYFDVRGQDMASEFIRATNFANTMYYYHWEMANDEGKKSAYGKSYGDSIVAAGVLADPKPGELVRVTKEQIKKSGSRKKTVYKVQYNPNVDFDNRDVYAAMVMTHTAQQIAQIRYGKDNPLDIARAIVRGAHCAGYLNTYSDMIREVFGEYLKAIGLKKVNYKELMKVIEKEEGYGSNKQVKAVTKFLRDEHGINTRSLKIPPLRSSYFA